MPYDDFIASLLIKSTQELLYMSYLIDPVIENAVKAFEIKDFVDRKTAHDIWLKIDTPELNLNESGVYEAINVLIALEKRNAEDDPSHITSFILGKTAAVGDLRRIIDTLRDDTPLIASDTYGNRLDVTSLEYVNGHIVISVKSHL